MTTRKTAKSVTSNAPLMTEARLSTAIAAAFLLVFSVQTVAVFA